MNKFLIKFYLLLAIFFLFLAPVKAVGAKEQKIVHIKANEIVAQNIYTFANEIIVDGSINGDLMAIAEKITINGKIEGDLIALAQEININGSIDGNVRIAGENFQLSSSIYRNLNVLAGNISLKESSRIFWDASLAGNNISARGKIDGSLKALAKNITISGEIGENADIRLRTDKKAVNSLNFSGAIINGNLNYRSNNLAEISSSSKITGEIRPQLIPMTKNNYVPKISWGGLIYKIISALIFGFLIIVFGRKHLDGLFKIIKTESKKLIMPALVMFFGSPLAAIIIFVSIIGIPLSLTIIALWLILQYLAKILIMIFGGQLLIKFFRKEKSFHIAWALVVGVIISYLLFSLPFIGGLLSLLASLAGLGALYLYVTNKSRSI